MNTIYVLPKDLNDALKNLENSIISSLKLSSFRFTIEFNFCLLYTSDAADE